MEAAKSERLENALDALVAAKLSDPDREMFESSVEKIRQAYSAGVGAVHIWTVLKAEGFKGGKEKLARFMSEAGMKDKKQKKMKRSVKSTSEKNQGSAREAAKENDDVVNEAMKNIGKTSLSSSDQDNDDYEDL